MTLTQQIITVAMAVLATMLTRFLPFLLFPSQNKTPRFVIQLGELLPPAILGMLVIYSYREQLLPSTSMSVIALIAGLVTVGLHVWKRNMVLSILGGTAVYMLFINIL